jgi:RNA polymerase I-specific transcription initiation factor RRN6
MKWLLRSHPETFPANQTISAALKTQSPSASTFPIHEGCLLNSARAKDINRVSGSHRPIILAFPSGASGQILHLLRPTPETRGWKNQSEARLKLLDPNSIEHGYWNGTGGPIRQIASAEENGLKAGPWLGVRQDTVITIFEPKYGMLRGSRGLALSRAEKTPTSLLHPNPVVTLPVDRTVSRCHVDFSFNPFYPRQFAVIDDLGRWSIWNMENLHDKGSSRILSPGRRGELSEASVQYGSDLKESSHPEHFDGWHKVMWACDVDTIVVCSRRCIAVFNVKSNPERLQSPDFLSAKGAEWIVDAVRSPAHPDQVFVLTTAQIYWMKVIPAGDEDQSVKVLQSYRHAGDANAETMKLTVVNGDSSKFSQFLIDQ